MESPTTGAGWRRAASVLTWTYVLFVAGFAIHTSCWSFLNRHTLPYFDDWGFLDDMFSTPLHRWVFADKSGHRLPLTRFLFFLDHSWFGGEMRLLAAATLLCAWLAAVAFYVGFGAGESARAPSSRAFLAFGVFLLFWSGGCFDFLWGLNQGSQMARMWLLVAVGALAVDYERRRRRQAGGAGPATAAGLASLLATFSQPMGAATWASVNVLSIASRMRLAMVAGLFAAALASIGAYRYGMSGRVSPALGYPLLLLPFSLRFLGTPVAEVAAGLGWIGREGYADLAYASGVIALIGLALYALLLWRGRRVLGARDLVALGLMVFAVAGSALVGANRAFWPGQAMSIRYVTWTSVFWIGAACAVSSGLGAKARESSVAIVLLWLLSLAMLPALDKARAMHAKNRAETSLRAAMLLSGVQWDLLARADMDPASSAITYRVTDRLRRDRLGFFAGGRGDLPGSRIGERFEPADASRCTGMVQVVRGVGSRRPAVVVYGRAWDVNEARPPTFVLMADSAGVIRGVGEMMPIAAAEHADATPQARAAGKPWAGFIDGFDGSKTYLAYAVLADGRTICALGAWPPQPPQRRANPGATAPSRTTARRILPP